MPPTCKKITQLVIRLLTKRIVCPYCCNCLTIAKAEPDAEHPQGVNAFTCRTCPYQYKLDHEYSEMTHMKKKQKDDIMGEEESDLPINEGLDYWYRSTCFSTF